MQIVIDISEENYEVMKASVNKSSSDYRILEGTPLPKGHGRLIDADDIDNHIIGHVDTRNCPTIIGAYTESEGDKDVST